MLDVPIFGHHQRLSFFLFLEGSLEWPFPSSQHVSRFLAFPINVWLGPMQRNQCPTIVHVMYAKEEYGRTRVITAVACQICHFQEQNFRKNEWVIFKLKSLLDHLV